MSVQLPQSRNGLVFAGIVASLAFAFLGPAPSRAQDCSVQLPCGGVLPGFPGPPVVGCDLNFLRLLGVGGKPWTARSSMPQILRGELLHFRWCDRAANQRLADGCDAINDRDANFILRPIPEHREFARNLLGFVNTGDYELNERGVVEAEVRTIRSLLGEAFPIGSSVTAKGWWVEDVAHEIKTELHPLISLIRRTGTTTTALVTQDWSDRFCAQQFPIEEVLSIPVFPVSDRQLLSGYTGTTSRATLISERSILDAAPGSRSSLTASQIRVGEEQGQVQLALAVSLPPATSAHHPVYLGSFTMSTPAAFRDSIGFSMAPDSTLPGCQVLETLLDASFDPLAGGRRFQNARWSIEVPGAAAIPDVVGERLLHIFRYSPCAQLNDRQWRIVGRASTESDSFLPPPLASVNLQSFFADAPARVFAFRIRTYEVPASRVEVRSSNTLPQPTAPAQGGPGGVRGPTMGWTCGGETELRAAVTLAPLQQTVGVRWVIEERLALSPAPGAGPTVYVVDATSPAATTQMFSAALDASDPSHLTLSWSSRSGVVLPAGAASGTRRWGASLSEPYKVRFEARTPIGESLDDEIHVHATCVLDKSGSPREFLLDVLKLELALRKLGASRFPEGGSLPPRLLLLKAEDLVVNASERIGEPVHPRNLELLEMVARVFNGERLDPVSTARFASAIAASRKIRFDTAIGSKQLDLELTRRAQAGTRRPPEVDPRIGGE